MRLQVIDVANEEDKLGKNLTAIKAQTFYNCEFNYSTYLAIAVNLIKEMNNNSFGTPHYIFYGAIGVQLIGLIVSNYIYKSKVKSKFKQVKILNARNLVEYITANRKLIPITIKVREGIEVEFENLNSLPKIDEAKYGIKYGY